MVPDRLPRVVMALAQLAEGGCPPRKLQCVQAEMWLGQGSCVSSSDSAICARLPSVQVGIALSGWVSPCSAHPLPWLPACAAPFGPYRLVFLFSDQNWGLQQLVSSDTTPQWRKALCRRGEQAKKKILNKPNLEFGLFLKYSPFPLLRIFLRSFDSLFV